MKIWKQNKEEMLHYHGKTTKQYIRTKQIIRFQFLLQLQLWLPMTRKTS